MIDSSVPEGSAAFPHSRAPARPLPRRPAGQNEHGQLGVGTTDDVHGLQPLQMGARQWAALSIGERHAAGVTGLVRRGGGGSGGHTACLPCSVFVGEFTTALSGAGSS